MPLLKPTRGFLLNKSHPLARGVVGCWLMNEGAGAKVADLSGNKSDGALEGGVVWTAGRFGRGVIIPRYDDIALGDISSLFSDEATLVMWLKTNQDPPNSIYDTGVAILGTSGLTSLYPHTGSNIYMGCFRNGRLNIGNVGVDKTKWHQLIITSKPGANNYIFYQNAAKYYSTTGLSQVYIPSASYLGKSVGDRWLDGNIDHAIIWNRALSASEIAWLYREPFCMFERAITPGLIGGPIINLAGTLAALSSLSVTAKAIRKVGGTVASTSDVAVLLSSISGEESSSDIERSWLREALFNGMTANAFKLGTTLSLGWFWIRVTGCSVLYRGPSMEQIDFMNVLTVAGQNACEISPPSYIPHNSSSTYFYVVRRFSNCGYQELTLAAAAKVSIDASGELEKPQPNNVFSSKAEQVDGNKIQLVWFYYPLEQKSQPVRFNVYYDARMGQIDYENPLAKISYEGRRFYSYQSGALDAGGYLFMIRAEDADGVENSSSAQLRFQLDTINPDAIDILSAETV
jgi:hypothetical protein